MKRIALTVGVVLLVAFGLFVLQGPGSSLSPSVAIAQEKKMEMKQDMGQMKMMENKTLDKIRGELKAEKSKLAKKGQYSCCNAPSCDNCAIAMNMCPCRDNLKKGDAVCGECADGWSTGHGDVEGVDASTVKRMSGDMLKMATDMRAKMYGEKMKGMKK